MSLDVSVPGGGRFRDEALHLWTLNDAANVVRQRTYVHAAKAVTAAGVPNSEPRGAPRAGSGQVA